MTSPEAGAIPEGAQGEFDAGAREFVEGNNDVAITHLKKAVELHPAFHDAYYLLGLAQKRAGDRASAAASLKQVVDSTDNVMLREYAEMQLTRLGS